MGNIRKIESLRSLAGLFSASLIAKSVAAASPDIVERRIRKHITNIPASQGSRYADFFGLLYQELSSLYANEYIFKNTIINTVRKDIKYNDSIILDELTIGKAIADMVIINGEAELYEIKTMLDSPDRLMHQLHSYFKAIPLVNVVIHKTELNKYFKYLHAESCGILVFSLENGLERIRKAEPNYSSLDHTTIFKLLRKGEYLKIVNENFNPVPDVPNTEIFQYCLSQVKKMDLLDFQKLSFQVMKLRKENLHNFFSTFPVPYEFAYVFYQINLNSSFYIKFDQFLDKTIN